MTPTEIQRAVNITEEKLNEEARAWAKFILEGNAEHGTTGQKIEDHEDAAEGIAIDFKAGYMACLQNISGQMGIPISESYQEHLPHKGKKWFEK